MPPCDSSVCERRSFYIPFSITVTVIAAAITHMLSAAECRSSRILTGMEWTPVTGVALNVNTTVKTAGSHPLEYLVPPPSDTRYEEDSRKPQGFVPVNFPSLQNHRLPGNWSELEKENEVNVTRVASVYKPVTAQKSRQMVNMEKFRECIFFRICPKSECFHYGRFGRCKWPKVTNISHYAAMVSTADSQGVSQLQSQQQSFVKLQEA